MDREEKRKCGHRALATRELLHVAKAFGRRHGGELDAVQIWLRRILKREVCGAAERYPLHLRQILVDIVNDLAHMAKGGHEALIALGLQREEAVCYGAGIVLGRIPLTFHRVQTCLHFLVLLECLHVWGHAIKLTNSLAELGAKFLLSLLQVVAPTSILQPAEVNAHDFIGCLASTGRCVRARLTFQGRSAYEAARTERFACEQLTRGAASRRLFFLHHSSLLRCHGC
mmetsp:Transcript_43429/g.72215  ORF Transcript_43429/g.72215 Transcript_43429/m.72215 type:complete len:228 (-) Transcript_43429:2968-3651(-)